MQLVNRPNFRRWRVSLIAVLPSLLLVAVGILLVCAGIWVVPNDQALASICVVLGSAQVTLGAVVSRVESFGLGPGGLKAVLVATRRRALAEGLDRHGVAYALSEAVYEAAVTPAELSSSTADEIAGQAVETTLRRLEPAEGNDELNSRGLEEAQSSREEPKRELEGTDERDPELEGTDERDPELEGTADSFPDDEDETGDAN